MSTHRSVEWRDDESVSTQACNHFKWRVEQQRYNYGSLRSLKSSFSSNLYPSEYFTNTTVQERKPFDHCHVVAATGVLSIRSAHMPLKYQQQLKILYTTKSGCLPSCFRGLLKAIYFVCVRSCQFPLWVKTLLPNSIFGAAYRLMPVSKQHMSHIAQTVSNLFRYIICHFFLFNLGIWASTSTLLIIVDWWHLIYWILWKYLHNMMKFATKYQWNHIKIINKYITDHENMFKTW